MAENDQEFLEKQKMMEKRMTFNQASYLRKEVNQA